MTKCPDCQAIMVKMFVETHEHTGYAGMWACACIKQDFEKVAAEDRFIVYSHAPLSAIGQAVKDIFTPKGDV